MSETISLLTPFPMQIHCLQLLKNFVFVIEFGYLLEFFPDLAL